VDRIPIGAKVPFRGYGFAGDQDFHNILVGLQTITECDLFQRSFGMKKDDILASERRIHGKRHVQIIQAGKSPIATWIRAKDFRRMREEWQDKIGDRVEMLPAFSLIALEAERRLRPHSIDFSPHNMREAALRMTNLGYLNHATLT